MRLSNYFLPLRKDMPADVAVKSHELMVKSGMIKQISGGLYAWLPLGYKVLRRFEQVIREEMEKFGFNEILMPTVQPASLWHESGRGNFYGVETLRFKDRHEREYIYGPTAEEVVTFIARDELKSYKQLPLSLYNMQWKFRDEIRPRFGVMRSREFLMLDSYSFDESEEAAKASYNAHYDCFVSIFARLGLTAIPMQADTGEIGGDLSHEFHILAETGESEIIYDKAIEEITGADVQNMREKISKFYAVTSEKFVANECPVDEANLRRKRGIEVGHIFYFADKYSKPMGLSIMDKDGKSVVPMMGSYGIGVGRLVAAYIEANHDEKGIIWNETTTPFDEIIFNLAPKDEACTKIAEDLYKTKKMQGFDILYDDTNDSIGVKLARADLIGVNTQIIVSPRNLQNNQIESRTRKTGISELIEIA